MPTKTYQFANDLGYSSMKVDLNGQTEIIPSVVAIQRQQNFVKPIKFESKKAAKEYVANLQNRMDVSVTSPAVKLPGRFLVGQRALDSGLPTRAFDVNDLSGKAQSDLSVILTLARLASQAITDAYNTDQDLTNIIKINVNMATALPISEAKTAGVTEEYSNRYLNGKHLVTFYNFAQPITVEITFKHVYVGFEGEMAQFEIANADDDLKKKIKTDFDKSYPDYQNEISADDLIALDNVLGIDIGEGTTDFSVIINGVANATASTSLANGYGNVLQDALGVLKSKGFNFKSRNDLNNYLSKEVSVLAKKRQDRVKEIVSDQLTPLVDSIIATASETMRHAGANIELVYVYGGGSIPLLNNTDMRERLVDKLKGFSGGYDIPVVWIDPTRARKMNEDGLTLYLNSTFN